MNLKALKNRLGLIVPLLKIAAEINPSNTQKYKLYNLVLLRKIIYEIGDLKLFADQIEKIEKTAIFSNNRDVLDVDINEYHNFTVLFNSIKTSLDSLYLTLNNILPEEDGEIISIKLPTIKDFSKLSEVTGKLDKIFSLSIYNEEIEGSAEILSIYPGSTWIDVNVKKPAAILLIAGMAWSAAVVHKKYQEGKMMEQQARSLSIKNESMQDIQDAQKRALDLLIDSESQSLYNEHFKNNDPEQKERLKLSIKMFSELINEGTEIYPALVAPESVSNLFPDYGQLSLIESKQKKLTQ